MNSDKFKSGQFKAEKEKQQVRDRDDLRDHYLTLGLEKRASQNEIREAFFRLKNTYSQSNQALYSLIEDDALTQSQEEIREAYELLSDDGLRFHYDLHLVEQGLAKSGDLCQDLHQEKKNLSRFDPPSQPEESRTLKKGRPEGRGADRQTYESETRDKRKVREAYESFRRPIQGATRGDDSSGEGEAVFQSSVDLQREGARKIMAANAMDAGVQRRMREILEKEDPADGSLYKKIRMLVGVSPEEMQDHIKISVGYIKYLEENCFDLLPQPVYVKGFLKSYLRFLGVPGSDRLVNAYAERLKSWVESREA